MVRDLTTGKPASILWRFTLPLFVSAVFQQLYNIADSVIVGNFASNTEDAVAAVGASYPITMIFMCIAFGFNVGCSVVISQLFGAKHYNDMRTAVTTTLISSAIISLVLTVLGIFLSRPMLLMINTPENILPDATAYLKIYTGGFVFLFLYNAATGIFTSLGDSKTPLLFLIGSSVSNILVDYLFVAVFHMDVKGVAWATFICQGIACILALITLKRRVSEVPITGRPAVFSGRMLHKIIRIAIPSILQQSFVSVGNIVIQNLVNSYGSSVIAGYASAIKINTFSVTCFGTLGNGLSSYAAQNMGAGKLDRVKQGERAGIAMCLGLATVFFLLCFFAGRPLLQLFMKDVSEDALSTGMTFLKIVSPFYYFVAIKVMTDGLLRGAGAMSAFMTSTFSDLILRVSLAFILSVPYGATGIWSSWPLGWVIGASVALLFYFRGSWKPGKRKKSIVE